MRSRLAALIAVLALAAVPATALAQSNPFLQQQQRALQTPTQAQLPPAPPPTQSSGGGLGNRGAILLGIAGAVVVIGIGLLIARDARKSVPKRRRTHTALANPDADARRTPGSRGRATRPLRGAS